MVGMKWKTLGSWWVSSWTKRIGKEISTSTSHLKSIKAWPWFLKQGRRSWWKSCHSLALPLQSRHCWLFARKCSKVLLWIFAKIKSEILEKAWKFFPKCLSSEILCCYTTRVACWKRPHVANLSQKEDLSVFEADDKKNRLQWNMSWRSWIQKRNTWKWNSW